MKLHPYIYRAGLAAALATGPTLVLAAGESAPASALSDNLIFIGAAVALIVFALTRKTERQTPPSVPAPEPDGESVSGADEQADDQTAIEEPAVVEAAEQEPGSEEAGSTESPEESQQTPPQSAA